jgi:urease accessory protein
MTARTWLFFATALVLAAGPAMAHPPPLGITGFTGGLLHPLFVPAHALALLGLGLLIAQQDHWASAVLVSFVAVLAAGLGVMTLGVVPRFANETAIVLAGVMGLLVAIARPMPKIAGCLLAAAAAFTIALDSPPEVLSVNEANIMLLGTGIGATFVPLLVAACLSRFTGGWARIATRILGSWIAASAILVLALRLAR